VIAPVTPAPVAVRALAAALALAALAAVPARAALFDDEEARKRIEATNQRLTQIQRQLDERIASLETQLKSQGLVELFNQVELLKADAARLRGQYEVLAHELDETQKRQRDLYVDLDTRVRRLEAGPAAAAPGAPTAPGASGAPAPAAAPSGAFGPAPAPGAPAVPAPQPIVPPAGAAGAGPAPGAVAPTAARPGAAPADAATAEQRAYDAALDLFKAGNYAGAVGGFTAFVKAYPKSPLAPSAQYWVGNAQFAQRDFRGAIAAQRQLVAAYPDSAKVPDALLNIATSQFELGDATGARKTLNDIVAKFPQSDAAAKARARLGAR